MTLTNDFNEQQRYAEMELIKIAMVLISMFLRYHFKMGRVVIQVQLNLCDGTYSNTEVAGRYRE